MDLQRIKASTRRHAIGARDGLVRAARAARRHLGLSKPQQQKTEQAPSQARSPQPSVGDVYVDPNTFGRYRYMGGSFWRRLSTPRPSAAGLLVPSGGVSPKTRTP